jgi:hypothetical protein
MTELVQWLTAAPVQRDQNRELARVAKNTRIAEATTVGMGRVARQAMLETIDLAYWQARGSALVPEAAGALAHITATAAMAMSSQITRVDDRW